MEGEKPAKTRCLRGSPYRLGMREGLRAYRFSGQPERVQEDGCAEGLRINTVCGAGLAGAPGAGLEQWFSPRFGPGQSLKYL